MSVCLSLRQRASKAEIPSSVGLPAKNAAFAAPTLDPTMRSASTPLCTSARSTLTCAEPTLPPPAGTKAVFIRLLTANALMTNGPPLVDRLSGHRRSLPFNTTEAAPFVWVRAHRALEQP
jgi:hypothetical protein